MEIFKEETGSGLLLQDISFAMPADRAFQLSISDKKLISPILYLQEQRLVENS